jgi:DNA modification methylase
MTDLEDGIVQTCVTSPPYYGVRDYGDIGSEDRLEDYVATLVRCFREVRRVLRGDGTLFLNMGDTYARRSLLGVPWALANALRDDGWWLRDAIVWSKPNPAPASFEDRLTPAHEMIFLLAKSERYFFDADGIPEAKRNVWTLPVRPSEEAHFGTFPIELPSLCIRAGSSEFGACACCGAPRRRVTEVAYDTQGRTTNGPRSLENRGFSPGAAVRAVKNVTTIGHRASCECDEAQSMPFVPQVVLDPFMGTGTTAIAATALGRRYVGYEINEAYHAVALARTRQRGLFAL